MADNVKTNEDDYDVWEIHEKIQYAFSNVNSSFPLKDKDIIIQFWAPIPERLLLSTSNQPFVLGRGLGKYRLCAIKYQYSTTSSIIIPDDDDEKNAPRTTSLINGSVATAFLNRLPEVVHDLRVHRGKGNPLLDSALDCGLTCSIMLPVFSQTSTSCVGVVECSMKLSKGLYRVMFNGLKHSLEGVGLSISRVQQEGRQYKAISGLKPPKNEFTCLTSFKLASGKQLADDLSVLQTPKPLKEETNRLVSVKRKFSDLNQANQEPFEKLNNTRYLVIVARYNRKDTVFSLPSLSSNVANIMEKINLEFNLVPGTYKLQYEGEPGKWFWLFNDYWLETCLLCAKRLKKSHINMRVHVCKYQGQTYRPPWHQNRIDMCPMRGSMCRVSSPVQAFKIE